MVNSKTEDKTDEEYFIKLLIHVKKAFIQDLGLSKGQKPWQRVFLWSLWACLIFSLVYISSFAKARIFVCDTGMNFDGKYMLLTSRFIFEDCSTECGRYNYTCVRVTDKFESTIHGMSHDNLSFNMSGIKII